MQNNLKIHYIHIYPVPEDIYLECFMHIYSEFEYMGQPVNIQLMFCPLLTFILYEITF